MRGSVRKRGKTWSYRIDLGKIDGKRKQKEKGGFKTKKEAQIALNMVLNELNVTGKIITSQKITLQELFDRFIENEAVITRKYPTIKRYISLYTNHLKSDFGEIYIEKITAEQIQKILVEKSKRLSAEYVKSIYNLIFVLFNFAERMEYIKDNVMKKVTPPKREKKVGDDIKIYTQEELKILSEIVTENLQPAFQIALNTGVRAGECYALRWSDVDFEKNEIKIDKQLQNYNKKWSFTTLKTSNSYRTIKISNNFKQYLLKLKEKQELGKEFYKDCYKTNIIIDTRNNKKQPIQVNDFINIKPNGEMLNTNSHKVIARKAKQHGIDFKFHNLRHTHATLLLEKGINPRYIQQRLGHSKLEFTLRLYTHVTANMDNQVIDVLDNTLQCPQV